MRAHFVSLPILIAAAIAISAGADPVRAAETTAAAQTSTLTVTFTGLKTQTGAVMFTLAGSPAAYDDKAPAAAQAMLTVSSDSVSQTFSGLAPGRYAIKAFHDVNGDGKMNTNPFGIPIEPFAFSNNAVGGMGPAKWEAASFEVKAGANTHTLTID